MILKPLKLHDCYIIDMELLKDNRGFFTRMYSKDFFTQHGLVSNYVQESISYNAKKGTTRGLHFQTEPFSEEKIVRCIKGSIYEVILDIREDSPTYGMWEAFIIKASDYKYIYLPKGIAHGFQTLEDDTEILYKMSVEFNIEHSGGFYYLSSELNIPWPITENVTISDRDKQLEEFIP